MAKRSNPEPSLDDAADVVARVSLGAEPEAIGRVAEFADGLAVVTGLPGVELGELLTFADGSAGFVLNIEADEFHAVLLDGDGTVEAGDAIRRTGRLVSVPVGEGLLGRVVDPLGRPLDCGKPVSASETWLVERPAPAIIERDFVSEPVETGLLVIDSLFAIGRGQRELIIGERATGKTSIAIDTIVNQKASDLICIYVAIGQRTTAVERAIAAVRQHGAIERTIFVVAPATAAPGLRWLAPFAGTSIAEYFRDRGQHALIVYDDLTKHAATHRELALLARQPPGREAYPGDIFYLHARLLERAAKLSPGRGSGSLTALPIAEIEAGNLSAYIPTNLISICDGQIVLSTQLFAANQRPAVDVGLSVSRVGGKAQSKAVKQAAGRVRLDYAQYLELRMFSRFGGFGDQNLRRRIAHGERISALFAQPRLSPLAPLSQVVLLTGLSAGLLDDVAIDDIAGLAPRLAPILASEPGLADFDVACDDLSDDIRDRLNDCLRRALRDLARHVDGEGH